MNNDDEMMKALDDYIGEEKKPAMKPQINNPRDTRCTHTYEDGRRCPLDGFVAVGGGPGLRCIDHARGKSLPYNDALLKKKNAVLHSKGCVDLDVMIENMRKHIWGIK